VSDSYVINGRGLSLYVFKRRVIKQIAVIIKAYCPYQLHTKFYMTCQAQLHIWTKLLCIISVDLSIADQVLILLYIYQVLERDGVEWGVIQLLIDLKEACD
jgi:hypothetical protein